MNIKVVAFNGSPNKDGNTSRSIQMVLDELGEESIDTELIHVGNKNIRGCTACFLCRKNKDGNCSVKDEYVNGWIDKIRQADGIILGSPVYYAGIAGTLKSFLDRAFFVLGSENVLRYKVGAGVAVNRRSGGMPTWYGLNNYFSISEMISVNSNYWPVIHGSQAGEVEEDIEGKQIMRALGKNMAWLLKAVKLGKEQIKTPEQEGKIYTNFVR